MARDVKVYKYKVGEKYSCNVVVIDKNHTMFTNIVVPNGTCNEVMEKFLDNAEAVALKMNSEGKASWSNS